MIFDTLKNVEQMKEVGFSQKQSEAIVKVWSTVVRDQFVTKQDLREAFLAERINTSHEFANVRTEFRAEFAKVRAEMKDEFSNVHTEIASVKRDLLVLEKKMTIKLGAIMIAVVSSVEVIGRYFS